MTDKTNDPQQIADDQPTNPARRRIFEAAAAVGLASSLPTMADAAKPAKIVKGSLDAKLKAHLKTVVVIYLENRSFNNLFANFPGTAYPLSDVTPAQSQQMDRNGQPMKALPKFWGGLVPGHQNIGGKDYLIKEDQIQGLGNAPFKLSDADGNPLPEGLVTRDLVHRFYNNQMQINGGKNDGFAAWADSWRPGHGPLRRNGQELNLWQIASQYTLGDNFFMGAFGGSYPESPVPRLRSSPGIFQCGRNGRQEKAVRAGRRTDSACAWRWRRTRPPSALDGKPKYVHDNALTPDGYAVNTMAPPYQPSCIRPAPGGDPRLRRPGRRQHAAAANLRHDRRPAVAQGRQLGLVRRRLAGGAGA